MNAPPAAEFLEPIEDSPTGISAVEKSIAASDKFEEMILSLSQSDEADVVASAVVPDSDLDVLEMDNYPEDESSQTPADKSDVQESLDDGNLLRQSLDQSNNDESLCTDN